MLKNIQFGLLNISKCTFTLHVFLKNQKTFYKHSQYKVLLKTFIKYFLITQETRFDWKLFKNIYKIAEEMEVKLEMFLKHSSWNV